MNKVNYVRNLLEKKKFRKEERKLVVEGERAVNDCLDRLEFVLYSKELPILKKIIKKDIECIMISDRNLKKISDVENPQGILGVVKEPEYSINDLFKTPHPLILISVGIQDPGNLGTIIRTADAAGAAGIIVASHTVDRYNQKVIRSSMGSIFHLPVLETDDLVGLIKEMKDSAVKVMAAEAGSATDLWHSNFSGACAIILGNEGAGLPEKIQKLADQEVSIPIVGKAESLNVAISASVLLYEAIRQRRAGGKS